MGRFDSKGAVALLAGILLVGWGQIVTLDPEKPQLIRYEFPESLTSPHMQAPSLVSPPNHENECLCVATPPPPPPELPRNRKVSMLVLRNTI